MTLLELAERCEEAEAPDRVLDARIVMTALGWSQSESTFWSDREKSGHVFRYTPPGANKSSPVPTYTASLDAALTLVPEGCKWWRVEMDSEGYWGRVQGLPCQAATPALALCAAALRARAAQ